MQQNPTKHHIYIADPDPDVKKKKLSNKQFMAQWTGISLFFAPSPEFKPNQTKQSGLTNFLPIIFKQKGLVSNIVASALIVILISISSSYNYG